MCIEDIQWLWRLTFRVIVYTLWRPTLPCIRKDIDGPIHANIIGSGFSNILLLRNSLYLIVRGSLYWLFPRVTNNIAEILALCSAVSLLVGGKYRLVVIGDTKIIIDHFRMKRRVSSTVNMERAYIYINN